MYPNKALKFVKGDTIELAACHRLIDKEVAKVFGTYSFLILII